MTLILFFMIIHLTTISDALVCYQCKGASTISNPFLKILADALLKEFIDQKSIGSHNIFCNNIDDLGEEKTCGSGSYCYSRELQFLETKEKVVIRSCVKQDQEDPAIMGCKETDNAEYNWKQKECGCQTNRCNGNGNGNGNTNGNGNALTCHECDKTMQEAIDYELSRNKRELGHFCEGPNDLGKLKTCKEGEVCSKQIFEQYGRKIYTRFCDPDPKDVLMGKCQYIDKDSLRVCFYMVIAGVIFVKIYQHV